MRPDFFVMTIMKKAKEGIRARHRSSDGIIEVHFAEHPGHWIASKTTDREKALKWARQNRSWLIGRSVENLAHFCRGFYALDGKWVRRQGDADLCLPSPARLR
jgi:hypothetical protein